MARCGWIVFSISYNVEEVIFFYIVSREALLTCCKLASNRKLALCIQKYSSSALETELRDPQMDEKGRRKGICQRNGKIAARQAAL